MLRFSDSDQLILGLKLDWETGHKTMKLLHFYWGTLANRAYIYNCIIHTYIHFSILCTYIWNCTHYFSFLVFVRQINWNIIYTYIVRNNSVTISANWPKCLCMLHAKPRPIRYNILVPLLYLAGLFFFPLP